MDDEHLVEKTIERRVVHRGRFMTFRVDTIVDAKGKQHDREIVDHPGAVCVIPVIGRDVLMVRQYRSAVASVVLELPAGTLDIAPDGSIEDPAAAAPRELAEETGHRSTTWRDLGRFWTAPGFTNERMHLYLASSLVPIEGYHGPDDDEYLDLVRMSQQDAIGLAETGGIEDAKSIIGLLHLARLIDRGEMAETGSD